MPRSHWTPLHDPQEANSQCALAVVRYTAWMGLSDMEPRIFDVTELLYEDTLQGAGAAPGRHSRCDAQRHRLLRHYHDEVENFPRLQNLLNV